MTSGGFVRGQRRDNSQLYHVVLSHTGFYLNYQIVCFPGISGSSTNPFVGITFFDAVSQLHFISKPLHFKPPTF